MRAIGTVCLLCRGRTWVRDAKGEAKPCDGCTTKDRQAAEQLCSAEVRTLDMFGGKS